jgi:hypothetical protein
LKSAHLRQGTNVGRPLHGFGGALGRGIRGALYTGHRYGAEATRGATQPAGAGAGGGAVEAVSQTAQLLRVLQDIHGLMSGQGINVIVKNSDLQARFG